MKRALTSLIIAAAASTAPAVAQNDTAPSTSAQAEAPAPIIVALGGFHVMVLKDDEGGVASVRNDAGDDAVLAFLEPSAATAAKTEETGDMEIEAAPLLAIMTSWKGPILFEGGEGEIASAGELVPESEGFLAPVFFVTTDGQETRINTPQGPVTPILPSYEDAVGMAGKLEEEGVDASSIKIVPIEFASVLQQINSLDNDLGYRIFSHPETVAFIEANAPANQTSD